MDSSYTGRKADKSSTSTLPWSPFHRLPTELWHLIFSLACMDDGFTGRSLSQVSRYACKLSKQFKYQSLAIRSLLQANSLPSVLSQRSGSQQPVLHLSILFDSDEIYPTLSRKSSSPLRRITSVLSRFRSKQPPQSKMSRFDRLLKTLIKDKHPVSLIVLETLMTIAVNRLLTVVSSTLLTLSILINTPVSYIAFNGSPTLPLLQELTIAHGSGNPWSAPAKLLNSFQPLPQLRRLNLHRFHAWSDASDFLRCVSRLAPEVDIVMLPWIHPGWKGYWDSTMHLESFPWPSLHVPAKIYIQPPPLPLPSYPQIFYQRIISECREMAVRDDRLVFTKPDQEPWEFDAREL